MNCFQIFLVDLSEAFPCPFCRFSLMTKNEEFKVSSGVTETTINIKNESDSFYGENKKRSTYCYG